MEWHSVKKDGYPPEKRIVIVTIESCDGERWVCSDARYVSDLAAEGYIEDYVKSHPDGIWEWAYEAGADYWEDIREPVIAWADYPLPYDGENKEPPRWCPRKEG